MRLVFMGTPEFAVPSLERLAGSDHEIVSVISRPDRPRGRGRRLQPTPVKAAAEALDLPVYQPESLGDSETVTRLEAFEADLFVVVAFVILPRRTLEIPRMGSVNLHPSLLPRYRGAAPIQWAVINGETETGATTFLLSGRVDAGDLLLQEKTTIGSEETAGELHDRMMQSGADLVLRSVDGLSDGSLTPRPQSDEGATRAPKLEREDAWIRWDLGAESIRNLIRGTNPVPGAYTDSGGGSLKVLRAERGDQNGPNGVVVGVDRKRGVEVAAGEGSLTLTEVQPQGKRAMTGAEWARGCGIKVGDRFGKPTREGKGN